jgi:hypothetical protein
VQGPDGRRPVVFALARLDSRLHSVGRSLFRPAPIALTHETSQVLARPRAPPRERRLPGPDLDEDISVEGVVAGRPSGESQASLKRWLESGGGAA